jgi:hypothetical protein
MTILNQTTELIENGYTWGVSLNFSFFFLLIAGLLIVITFIYLWCMMPKDTGIQYLGAKVFCAFCVILGLIAITGAFHSQPTYQEVPQYEVILDNTIPFHEIYDKYDIIEQRGQIFVLRDKGWNGNIE